MKLLINFLRVLLAISVLLAFDAPSAVAQTPKHTKKSKTTSQKTTTQKNAETVKPVKPKKVTSQTKKTQQTKSYKAPKQSAEPYFMVDGQSSSVTVKKQSNEGSFVWLNVLTNETGGYYITGTPSWCKISDKNSGGFYLECTANPSKQTRSGSFDVVSNSSNKSVRIYVNQEATIPDVTFDHVTVKHDEQLTEGLGMTIKFKMSTTNLGGKSCHANVYFYDSNGKALMDSNNRYKTVDGQVCSSEEFSPTSNHSEYTDFNVQIPYSELHLTGSGKKSVKYRIIVWDENDPVARTELYSTSVPVVQATTASSYTASTSSTSGTSTDSSGSTSGTSTSSYGSTSGTSTSSYGTSSNSSYSSGNYSASNVKIKTYRPWHKRYWGISVGYVQKQWEASNSTEKLKYGFWDLYDPNGEGGHMDGIQAGLRFEPYAKFGLGVNMGVFYEFYFSKSKTLTIDNQQVYGEMTEQSLYAPVHLCYRLRFGEFQLFAFGGAGFDYSLNYKMKLKYDGSGDVGYEEKNEYDDYNWKRFNISYEFGGGIRVHSVQASFTMSKGITDMSNSGSYKVKQNKPMMVSLGIMF